MLKIHKYVIDSDNNKIESLDSFEFFENLKLNMLNFKCDNPEIELGWALSL